MWKAVVYTPELTTKVVNQAHCKDFSLSAFRPPLPTVIFSISLLVYGLTRTHLNTFDAVAYANQIGLTAETGKLRPLFHPHHLLFNALGYLWWRIAQTLGYRGGPLAVMQEMNAVLGAAGLTLYHATLRRLQPSGPLPLLVTLCLAGSFGYWICATDGRVNMPSIVLMIAAFHTLICFREAQTTRLAAVIGALAGAAVLFHESAGLFGIAGAFGVFSSTHSLKRCLMALYASAWIAAVAVPYVLVGVFVLHFTSWAAFHGWAGAYAERGWWWDFHVIHNLRLDLFALRHAIFVEPLGRAALAPLHTLGLAGVISLWGLYGGALAGLLGAGALIARTLPRLLRSPEQSLTLTCLLWVGVYALFFTVWCPGAFVFWVPTLIPLGAWLLLSLTPPRLDSGKNLTPTLSLERRGRREATGEVPLWLPKIGTRGLLTLWFSSYTLLNFLTGVLPYLKPVAGLSQRVAADITAHTPPRALIVVAGVGDDAQCEVDVPYFAHRPVLSLHGLLAHAQTFPAAQSEVQMTFDRAFGAGRNVYVLDELWANRRTVSALRRQCPEISAVQVQALFAAYRPVPAWRGPRGIVWKLSRP